MNNLGYTKPLFILAFDHRSSFIKNLLRAGNRELSNSEIAEIIELKQIIYEGFKYAIANGLPRDYAAILVDEQFGSSILKDARQNGYNIILTADKSGQEEFDFEYGTEFSSHIEKFKPDFVKALVRYNPEGDKELNKRQLEKLSKLSTFCHTNNYKLLIEPLVLPTQQQLQAVQQDKNQFDKTMRPTLTVKMIQDFQERNAEPDIWKIEGMEDDQDYKKAVEQTRENGRNNVGIVVLGRGENTEQVEQWLNAARNVSGIIGFAIGRTIFMEPLLNFRDKKISREQTIKEIAKNYRYFYNVFTNK